MSAPHMGEDLSSPDEVIALRELLGDTMGAGETEMVEFEE